MAARTARFLVIHGAGFNMRGKLAVAQFGTTTMPEYEEKIRGYAKELNCEVTFFQSNVEGELINRLYEEHEKRTHQGIIINPAGNTLGYRAFNQAIAQVNMEGQNIPIIEVHLTNLAAKAIASEVAPNVKAIINGFGVFGYRLGLEGLLNIIGTTK